MARDQISLTSLWNIKKEFLSKVLFLALTFAFMTGTQALWRSLKSAVFSKIVGATLVNSAKLYSIFFMIPLIMVYSKLVDMLQRHQMVYVFTLFHAIGGLGFTYLLAHPTYGVANTVADKGRIVGWAFYFFMESFSAFLATTFWAFANSVNKPNDARNHYGIFVIGSKLGGIFTAGLMWLTLTVCMDRVGYFASFPNFDDQVVIPGLLFFGSLLLFCAAGCIYTMMVTVPGYYMHGYEAVYQLEKKRDKEEPMSWLQSLSKSLEGVYIIATQPYVLGIFMLSLFHDTVMVILDYRVLVTADKAHKTVGALAQFYSLQFLMMHTLGLAIALFGTSFIMRNLGTRLALLVHPIVSLVIAGLTFFFPDPVTFSLCFVTLRASNYGLNHPVREQLYIPTTKQIKFKSKAWTDAFGTRIAKSTGASFNIFADWAYPIMSTRISSAFSAGISVAWIGVSYLLGITLQHAINRKRVIGEEHNSK